MKLVVLVLDADWSVQYSSCTKVHDIFTPTVQHETTVYLYAAQKGNYCYCICSSGRMALHDCSKKICNYNIFM